MDNYRGELQCLGKRQQSEFQAMLASEYRQLPDYLKEEPLWSPLVHSSQEYGQLVGIQRAIQSGLQALHEVLPEDERLHRLLSPRYTPELRSQLSVLNGVPLTNQFIRPDYIIDNKGEFKVCEINTRFIFNGNIAGVHAAQFLAGTYDIDISPYQSMDKYMHDTYDGPGLTAIVRGAEPVHDLLLQAQRSESVRKLRPELLDIVRAKKIGRVILELHQHELERVVPHITRLMLKGVPVYNDPRTVDLLHDKRLLVPLSDADYMAPLVGEKKARLLAKHVITSYHPNWEGREPETMEGKSALVKRAVAGKSQGMRMVRLSEYRERLDTPETYVYQSRIRQAAFATNRGLAEIAGTLPMTLDGKVFGPGIVRVLAYNRLRGFFGLTVAARSNA